MHLATGDTSFGDIKMYMTDPPIKWKADLTGYEPGLAEAYEWSEDGKTFTMHMRKGVKWSDGEPYTSADWKFWWEDMANAPDQKKSTMSRLTCATRMARRSTWNSRMISPLSGKSTDRALWIDPYFLAQGFWEFADPKMKPAHFLKHYPSTNTPRARPGKT